MNTMKRRSYISMNNSTNKIMKGYGHNQKQKCVTTMLLVFFLMQGCTSALGSLNAGININNVQGSTEKVNISNTASSAKCIKKNMPTGIIMRDEAEIRMKEIEKKLKSGINIIHKQIQTKDFQTSENYHLCVKSSS